jgi:hypothetical protein
MLPPRPLARSGLRPRPVEVPGFSRSITPASLPKSTPCLSRWRPAPEQLRLYSPATPACTGPLIASIGLPSVSLTLPSIVLGPRQKISLARPRRNGW